MKTPHDRLGPVEITAKWRAVARTPEWDRLWQWIIATLMEENSGPVKTCLMQHRFQVSHTARSMMQTKPVDLILAALERLNTARKEDKGWKTRCPVPDHEDRHPSFFLYPGGGGKCFFACSRYWSPRELAELLGIQLEDSGSGLTVAELAEAKGLPEDFLRSLDVTVGSLEPGAAADRRWTYHTPTSRATLKQCVSACP